jgi:hypothetical protein
MLIKYRTARAVKARDEKLRIGLAMETCRDIRKWGCGVGVKDMGAQRIFVKDDIDPRGLVGSLRLAKDK